MVPKTYHCHKGSKDDFLWIPFNTSEWIHKIVLRLSLIYWKEDMQGKFVFIY